MKSHEPAKIAVVGAGMAGLTAAQKLLAGGAEVTIIEKSHSPGGRASTLERDSFFLNQGPHALYKGGAAYKILTKLNITPAGASPAPKRSLAIFKGVILDLPVDASSLVATKLLSITEKIEWGMLMGGLEKTDLSKLHNVSLLSWLTATVKSARVQEVFIAFVRLATYCNNPEKISAAAAIQQLLLVQKEGVLYLDRGWHCLVDSMLQLIRSEGKDKLTEIYEAEVTAISLNSADPKVQKEHEQEQVHEHKHKREHKQDQVEITINGTKQNFDAVVLALPPKQVSRLLASGSDNASLRATLDGILPSHAACLDVCLKKLPNLDNTFAIGIDEPLYYSVHSTTAKVAAVNHALVHLAVYLQEGEHGTAAHEKQLLELLDKLQPGWQEELVYKRFLPNMSASFGTALASENGSNGLTTVTLPVVPDADNIFVCGDWVGAGHLLVDAAMSSAVAAAEAALVKAEKKAYANLA